MLCNSSKELQNSLLMFKVQRPFYDDGDDNDNYSDKDKDGAEKAELVFVHLFSIL